MSLALVLLLAATAPVDCNRVQGAIARDECFLEQSLKSDSFNCRERPTQIDMNVCSYRDYLRADIELNRIWSRLAAANREASAGKTPDPSSQFGKYLDAQRAWLVYRDKQCEAEAAAFTGGSMQPLIRNTCFERVTQDRTAELKQIVDNN